MYQVNYSEDYFCEKEDQEAGFSLVEMLLVITFIALLTAGALAMYNSVRTSNNSSTHIRNLIAVQTAVHALYSENNDYTGLNNAMLYNAGKLPANLHYDDGTITTGDGGTLTVTGNESTYTVALTQVPSSSCTAIVTTLSNGWQALSVGETKLASSSSDFPVSAATASKACASASQVTMTYTGSASY